ncbi:MAG: FadR family transcriptional regulator [Anaerolineaceae bacterium]|nr:FadR family transcriptional regulator [Anaerolineaceae bacterium]
MVIPVEPLQVSSLKQACIERLEGMILSGGLKPGEKLPSERDFAASLGVSRPVLHEALVDLEAKGLVSILPRRGVVINDFRQSGSLAVLSSLLNYNNGALAPEFQHSLLAMRILIERETARLAAVSATPEQIEKLHQILQDEIETHRADATRLTELDFAFHSQLALASGNLVYPLILNSFKNIYIHFTATFFRQIADTAIIDEVIQYHQRLIVALANRQPDEAAAVMEEMLVRGEQQLLEGIYKERP